MVRILAIIITAITAFLSGCSQSNGSSLSTSTDSTTSAVNNSSANPSSPLTYTIVSSGVQRGINNQQMQVITSSEQFATLLSATTLFGDMPSTDFSTDELIGVFLGGNVGCGTDGLTINSVQETDLTVTVYATRKLGEPNMGGGCSKMPVDGLSYALISIPKTTKTVSLLFD
jgi:hypothetical protein